MLPQELIELIAGYVDGTTFARMQRMIPSLRELEPKFDGFEIFDLNYRDGTEVYVVKTKYCYYVLEKTNRGWFCIDKIDRKYQLNTFNFTFNWRKWENSKKHDEDNFKLAPWNNITKNNECRSSVIAINDELHYGDIDTYKLPLSEITSYTSDSFCKGGYFYFPNSQTKYNLNELGKSSPIIYHEVTSVHLFVFEDEPMTIYFYKNGLKKLLELTVPITRIENDAIYVCMMWENIKSDFVNVTRDIIYWKIGADYVAHIFIDTYNGKLEEFDFYEYPDKWPLFKHVL